MVIKAHIQSDPYAVRRPVSGSNFYGRKQESAAIMNLLKIPMYCSVVGDRRMGKTSLLKHIQRRLNALPERPVVVFIDLELRPTNQLQFYRMLSRHLLEAAEEWSAAEGNGVQLKLPSKESIRHINDAFTLFEEGIVEVIETLLKSASAVHLLIDEGDYLARESMGHGLRYLLNRFDRLGFVLASAEYLHKIEQDGPLSPLYNMFEIIDLGLLTREEAIELIEHRSSPPPIPFSKAEQAYILEVAGRHPHLLKVTCSRLLAYKKKKGIKHLPLEQAEFKQEMLEELLLDMDPTCSALYERYQEEREVLEEIAFGRMRQDQFSEIVPLLKRRGVVVEIDGQLALMSQIFEEYVRRRASKRLLSEQRFQQPLQTSDKQPPNSSKVPTTGEPISVVPPDSLTPYEDQLFSLLADIPGEIIAKEEIKRQIWEQGENVPDSHLAVLVQRLRKKLQKHNKPYAIVAQRGEGYRLLIEATETQ